MVAAAFVRRRFDTSRISTPPRIAVILGSGLGAVGQHVLSDGGLSISYDEIPHMPKPIIPGHDGRVVIGRGRHSGVLFLQGRVHHYEGHCIQALSFATRMLHQLGVSDLIITNAAGGVRSTFRPGDLMLVTGHWSFQNVSEPAKAHSRQAGLLWNTCLLKAARRIQSTLTVHEGSYAMLSGPNYETPAEVRMLQTLGVDAVGMSTVPEALAASNRGIRVLAVSCITNLASGLADSPLSHTEVGETAASIETAFAEWILTLIENVKSETDS